MARNRNEFAAEKSAADALIDRFLKQVPNLYERKTSL